MNDKELIKVLERDYKSLESESTKTYRIEGQLFITYTINFIREKDQYVYHFSVRKDTNKVRWYFQLYVRELNDEYPYASSEDGMYESIRTSTVSDDLKLTLVRLTREIIMHYNTIFSTISESIIWELSK